MTQALKHRTTRAFWKLYDQLPEHVRTQAVRNYALLKADPRHPSLHFKKVKDELWSVRIGIGFRALALADDVVFTWIWIGSHKEYDRLIK